MDSVVPATRIASQFYKSSESQLSSEYTTFLDKYPDGTILVAFGTTWMPTDGGITSIIEAAKQLPQIGLIVSLKEACTAYRLVQESNLPNIMLKKFVPQKELLNDDRIFAFISHGGGNSIVESLYYGKVLIGFPQSADQPGACYRVERMGAGISVGQAPTASKIVDAIKAVKPKQGEVNVFQENVKRVQKMIHFKELRQGKDLAYLLRKAIKFGEYSGQKNHSAKHLMQRSSIDNSFITVYDYDLKVQVLLVLIVCLLLVREGCFCLLEGFRATCRRWTAAYRKNVEEYKARVAAGYQYSGSLRPHPYSFEGRREVPEHIKKPDYAVTGAPAPDFS